MEASNDDLYYYNRCYDIYRELSSGNYPKLLEAISDLREQQMKRIASLDDITHIHRAQGKLQMLNELIDYKGTIRNHIESMRENIGKE